MAQKKLTLEIRIGNAATLEPEFLADLLRKAADQVEAGSSGRTLIDFNGNDVGAWRYEDPE